MNDRESAQLDRASEPMPDVLSDVLRAVRLKGAVFFDVHTSCPWVAEAPDSRVVAGRLMPGSQHVIPFHVMTHGSCHAAAIGSDPVSLGAGDVIVYPHGDPHVLSSEPGLRAPPDLALYQRSGYKVLPVKFHPGEGGEPRSHVICGFLGCDAHPFNPLLEALPRQIIVRRSPTAHGRWLDSFVAAALLESDTPSPGGECVLARMSELLFIEIVRRYVQSLPPDGRGWLAGLRDPAVGRALGMLHGEPAQPWTLELLAQRSGLSRSVLAEKFHALVGIPPMQYLTRWRMQLAAGLLAGSRAKVATIAREVGYDAEAAFSRAFKKAVGVSPGRWRRDVTAASTD